MQRLTLSLNGRPADEIAARIQPSGWSIASHQAAGLSLAAVTMPDQPVLGRAGTGGLLAFGDDYAVISGLPLNLRLSEIRSGRALAQALTKADGVFSAAIWCADEQRVLVLTDFLGNDPIYWRREADSIEIASATAAFKWQPDPVGWGSFVRAGHMVGNITLIEGVERIGPAQLIEIDMPNRRIVDQQTYYHQPFEAKETSTAVITDLFRAHVRDYAELAGESNLLLSGGVDSRIVLACALAEGHRPTAHIVQHADQAADADGQLALEVAKVAGVETHFHTPKPHFYSSKAYLDYLWGMEGAFPSHNLFIAKVMQFVTPPAVWEGELPNVSLRAIFPEGGFAAYDAMKIGAMDSPEMQAASTLFQEPFFEQMRDSFILALEKSREDLPDDPFGVAHWITLYRMGRRGGYNANKVYPLKAAALATGAGQDFWTAVMALPIERRLNYQLVWDMLETYFPEYAKIPLISGGKLMASPSGQKRLPHWQRKEKLFNWLGAYPSIGRFLGRGMREDRYSQFLFDPALFEEDDAPFKPETLARLRASDGSSEDPAELRLRALVFHWRAAQWVHQQCLYDKLTPRA